MDILFAIKKNTITATIFAMPEMIVNVSMLIGFGYSKYNKKPRGHYSRGREKETLNLKHLP